MNCHAVFNCVGHNHELTDNRLIKETVLKYVNEAEFKELFTIAALEKIETVTSSAIAATSSAIKASLDARNAVNDLTIQTIDFVNDAINNTAVEGGILADTFVTVNNTLTQRQVNSGLDNGLEIGSIANPFSGMRIFDKRTGKYFIFTSSGAAPVNDVTVLQGVGGVWEMVTPSVYYASWFADSASAESQATKLQQGYDYATKKRRPFIIDDEFWVDARATQTGEVYVKTAFAIRSNSVLKFQNKGKLKVIPNNYTNYLTMVAMDDVENYIILNPNLEGDRLTHTYPSTGTSEWGYGLAIYESKNGYIERPIIRQMTGDGLYVGKVWDSPNDRVPTNIVVMCPLIEYVRRNGISFCAWDNVKIIDPVVNYVGTYNDILGAAPESSVDIEPEISPGTPGTLCRAGVISNLTSNYSGTGLNTFINIDNLSIDVKFTGVTHLDNFTDMGALLSLGSKNNTGAVIIEHLHLGKNVAASRHIAQKWSADGTATLQINRVSYDFWKGSPLFLLHYGFGSFENKKLGNVQIRNVDARAAVYLTAPSGVSHSDYTLSFFDITKAEGSSGYIRYYAGAGNSLLTYPMPGDDVYVDAWHEIYENTALQGYRGPRTIRAMNDGSNTEYSIDVTGSRGVYRIEYPKGIADFTLNIIGLSYRTLDVPYSKATTITRGAWIELEVINQHITIVHAMSPDWVFS